ncbi:MAG: GyrI-like domain-containing protein [Anaerolineae bacterium]
MDIPEQPFLMIDGEGDPSQAPFQQGIGALYSAAFTLKFTFKKGRAIDFPVMPLEGLFGSDIAGGVPTEPENFWHWTIMITVPDLITPDDVAEAVAAAGKKKPNPALALVRLDRLSEGRVAQVLHIGPYAEEHATIEALHAFIAAEGYRPHGRHHEIYLSDPARTAPERMKTILRHPVEG